MNDLDNLTPFSDEIDHFDHIPQLYELVPHGGTPGYKYAQVCTHNLSRARRDKFSLVNRDAFVIDGPKGSADMILMVKGEANTLLSPTSGLRPCDVDLEVQTLTGLAVNREQFKLMNEPAPVPAPPPVKPEIKVQPAAQASK